MGRTAVELIEGLLGIRLGHRVRAGGPVDEHEARETLDARLAVEVPRRVRGGNRAAERVTADDHVATLLLGQPNDLPEVVDLGVHPPLLRVLDVAVRNRLHVVRDGVVGDPLQVVVEDLLGSRLAPLGAVEHRLVLEQVLAPLNGPDLPSRRTLDDRPGERGEVGGPRRGARIQDQDVRRVARAEPQEADQVQAVRSPGGLVAVDPVDLGPGCRRARRRNCGHEHRSYHHQCCERLPWQLALSTHLRQSLHADSFDVLPAAVDSGVFLSYFNRDEPHGRRSRNALLPLVR